MSLHRRVHYALPPLRRVRPGEYAVVVPALNHSAIAARGAAEAREAEQRILLALDAGPLTVAEIAESTGLPTSRCEYRLSGLYVRRQVLRDRSRPRRWCLA